VSFKFLLIVESKTVPLLAKSFSLLIILDTNNSASLTLKVSGSIGTNYFECLWVGLKVLFKHICSAIRREIP